ncbi:MAG: GGDEF domain-containing protein [Capsulimonadaceae bacterium]|nr:GGDEF domain-containing protein [Capsulimonadaceae bacterium]
MNRSSNGVRFALVSALAFATLILLSLLTAATFCITERLENESAAVDRTYAAQQTLANLDSAMSSADLGLQQGRFGQERSRIHTTNVRVRAMLAQSKALSTDNPALARSFHAIAKAVARHMRDVSDAVARASSPGRQTWTYPVRSERIARGLIETAHAEIGNALAERTQAVATNSNDSRILFATDIALVVINLALMIAMARRYYIQGNRRTRQIVEEETRHLRRANQELAELAKRDGLTGLINHRTFQERLAAEFSPTERRMEPISLMMIDVDHFKAYNDTFGHQAGDTILARLARILDEAGRGSDVVARYGGEEFAILLPATEASDAYEIAERLRARVETDTRQGHQATVSIGVASAPRRDTTPADLIGMADRALYISKENGRNQVTIASIGRQQPSIDCECPYTTPGVQKEPAPLITVCGGKSDHALEHRPWLSRNTRFEPPSSPHRRSA